ncbi:Dabb family protein [Tunicatimonas pelagia]|uniref:Dabb family protein n=1 Tax=Tunicatimonas pelagia TaxID=931531 RepID=UPI002666ECEB|nr:Dabb family protein [Tunicatimonas pelagia]WKN46202.1 Dabb family protein [Tunicatimonas pelagia]
MPTRFIHNVFFWLKNPTDADEAQALKAGIRTLFSIATVRDAHLGKPAPTDRAVIDNTYSYHLMLMFDNLEDQTTYQGDPIHLKFVDDCAHLWEKVQVYDSDASLLSNA